jgi:hypothetical protein
MGSSNVPLAVDGEDLVRVAPGLYDVTYVAHRGLTVFRTAKVRVDFQLIAHPDLIVPRWYRVNDYRGSRIRAGRHSDILRELSAILNTRLRHDRVAVASLKGLVVLAHVRDVTSDRKQNPLAPVNRYSVIERLESLP